MEFKNNHDFITLFENRLSDFTGAPYVVTVNSNTSAVLLSMICLEKFGQITSNVVGLPCQTYISVPQVLRHLGYYITLEPIEWSEKYNIKGTNIWDCAVGFKRNMYEIGTIQCLSFQQKKCIGVGQGGAILLDNKDMYDYLKRISWDGRDASVPTKDDLKNIIIDSFHMYLSPDNCVKGVLLLNQLDDDGINRNLRTYSDYPDLCEVDW